MKYVVICGPVLKEHDSQILNLLQETINQLGEEDLTVFILPEKEMGAAAVRKLVSETISDSEIQSAIFVTRYEHAVSEFANAVADGIVSRDDFLIKLVRYEDDTGKFYVTEHQMCDDNQYVGDDWPMGILW